MSRLVLISLTLFFSTTLLAEEVQDFDLTIGVVERFQSLRLEAAERAEQGVAEYLSLPEGQNLLVVDMTVSPKWTETIDTLRIDSKEQFLKIAQDEIAPLGSWRADGLGGSTTISIRRKRDWKKVPNPLSVRMVFGVPAAAKTGMLILGAKEVPLAFPETVKARGDVDVAMEAKMIQTAWIDKMPLEYRYNRQRQPSLCKNPNGRILAVTFTVHPIRANSDESCFWRTPWIGLLTEDGHYIPTFGEGKPERPTIGYNHTIRKNDEGEWKSKEVTYYFAVPSDLKSFTITSLTDPIGEGIVQE